MAENEAQAPARPITNTHSYRERQGRLLQQHWQDINKISLSKYSQISSYSHSYILGGKVCVQHPWNVATRPYDPASRRGFSFIGFNDEGTHLACVATFGCKMILSFKVIQEAGEHAIELWGHPIYDKKYICHSGPYFFDVVKWTPNRQDQIACISNTDEVVSLFDIEGSSCELTMGLHTGFYDPVQPQGLSDFAFTSNGTGILASHEYSNLVHFWDLRDNRRGNRLSTNRIGHLRSIDITYDDRVIFGADDNGLIHTWDGRMGRAPLHSYNLALGIQNAIHVQNGLRPAYKCQAQWMPNSVYAASSLNSNGVYLLDFCRKLSLMENHTFVPVRGGAVTAVAAHRPSQALVVALQDRSLGVIEVGRQQ